MAVRRLHATLFAVFLPAAIRLYQERNVVHEADAVTPSFRDDEYKEQQHKEGKTKYVFLDAADTSDLSMLTRPEQGELVDTGRTSHKIVDEHVNSTTPQIDMDDFHWGMKATCGAIKCYYHSRSDSGHIGYLVAPTLKKTKRRYTALLGAWKLAEGLQREHGIKHFLLAPPANVVVSKELFLKLNMNLWSERSQKSFSKRYTRFPRRSTVVVEKVHPAPKHKLLLGCATPKVHAFNKEIHKFIRKVGDKELFTRRFNESFTKVRELLHYEPCLVLDFQVFIDTLGNIYHFDFDRCFNSKTGNKKRPSLKNAHCYKSLDNIERQVYRALIISNKR